MPGPSERDEPGLSPPPRTAVERARAGRRAAGRSVRASWGAGSWPPSSHVPAHVAGESSVHTLRGRRRPRGERQQRPARKEAGDGHEAPAATLAQPAIHSTGRRRPAGRPSSAGPRWCRGRSRRGAGGQGEPLEGEEERGAPAPASQPTAGPVPGSRQSGVGRHSGRREDGRARPPGLSQCMEAQRRHEGTSARVQSIHTAEPRSPPQGRPARRPCVSASGAMTLPGRMPNQPRRALRLGADVDRGEGEQRAAPPAWQSGRAGE